MSYFEANEYLALIKAGRGSLKGASVKFFYDEIFNEKRTVEEGRPIYDFVAKVRVAYGSDVTICEIGDNHKEQFPDLYKAFLMLDAPPKEGTPLTEWSPMPRTTAREFKEVGIATIEQLVEIPDDTSNTEYLKLGSALIDWKKRAKDFIESAKKDVKVPNLVKRIKDLEIENKRLLEDLQVLSTRYEVETGRRNVGSEFIRGSY